jgi:hypothetical protein
MRTENGFGKEKCYFYDFLHLSKKCTMNKALLFLAFLFSFCVSAQEKSEKDSTNNAFVIETVEKYGPLISPTYQTAVCTKMVIGILEKLTDLVSIDKARINIEITENVYELMLKGSPESQGVYYALTTNGKGIPIDNLSDVKPGDFVQFWYPKSWGHCGIVKEIKAKEGLMLLYSSFPSTDGYGIEVFDIPCYCYFVRLKF